MQSWQMLLWQLQGLVSGPRTCNAALLALAEDTSFDAQLAHQVFECAAVGNTELASTYVSTASRRGTAADALRAYLATHHYHLPLQVVLQVLDALTVETGITNFKHSGFLQLRMYALSHCDWLNSLAAHRLECPTCCVGWMRRFRVYSPFHQILWLDDLQIQQQCSSSLWAMNKEAAKLPPPTHGHNSLQRRAALKHRHTPVSHTQMWCFRSLSIAHGLACSGTQQHGAVCGACSADKTT